MNNHLCGPVSLCFLGSGLDKEALVAVDAAVEAFGGEDAYQSCSATWRAFTIRSEGQRRDLESETTAMAERLCQKCCLRGGLNEAAGAAFEER